MKTVVVPSHSETMDVLAGLTRLARSLQARKGVLFFCLGLAAVLGGVYYVTADRVYESQAEITVLQTGDSLFDQNSGQAQSMEGIMPTYERNASCDRVIQETIKAVRRQDPEHLADLRGVRADQWIDAIRQRLSVSSPRDTNNIRISYRSGDPETAFVVVGNLVDSYLKFTDGYYHTKAERSLEFLRSEQEKQAIQLQELNDQKLQLISESPVILGNGEDMTNVLTHKVHELNKQLTEVTSRRLLAGAQIETIQKAMESGGDLRQIARQMSETVGTELFKNSLGVGQFDAAFAVRMLEDLVDLRESLRVKLQHYGPQHHVIRDLERRIQSREAELRALPAMSRESYNRLASEELGPLLFRMAQQEYYSALTAEEALKRQLDHETEQAAKFSRNLSQIQMVDNQIGQLQASIGELSKSIANTGFGQQLGLQTQIVTDPQINRAPVSPKLSLVVLVSFILGFAGGAAVIYLLDLIDDRFHSAEDMKAQLGAPILTSIQKLKPLGQSGLESLYTYARPNAPESEAFRTLRTAIDFSAGGVRRLTISSTQPSDGKTTVLSNLGVAFAQAGRRTLLIDGDMRRPGLTRLFERSGYNGLSTVLRDDRAIVESVAGLIYHSELENLHVLPSGPKPINPVELLTSERLSDLLAWAETQYDQVLIDAPPSLAVTDAAIIGRLVDGAILTVRPDRNRRKGVLRAAEALTSLGCELKGMVLNQIDPTQSGYAYGYGYGYGYGSEEPVAEEAGTVPETQPRPRKQAA